MRWWQSSRVSRCAQGGDCPTAAAGLAMRSRPQASPRLATMPPMSSTPRILVTGGTGYIAGVLIRQLLGAGWQVHATVRDLAREPALRQLLGVAPGDEQLRCFKADLMAD